MSNHDLKIERGRYMRPVIPRDERTCDACGTIENEHHVIFNCPIYVSIRQKYPQLIVNSAISEFLNPMLDKVHDIDLRRI